MFFLYLMYCWMQGLLIDVQNNCAFSGSVSAPSSVHISRARRLTRADAVKTALELELDVSVSSYLHLNSLLSWLRIITSDLEAFAFLLPFYKRGPYVTKSEMTMLKRNDLRSDLIWLSNHCLFKIQLFSKGIFPNIFLLCIFIARDMLCLW